MQSNQQLVTWYISFLFVSFSRYALRRRKTSAFFDCVPCHAFTIYIFHHIAVLSPRWNWLRAKIDPATYMLSRSSIRKRSKVKKTHWKTKFASSGGKFTFGNEEIILYIICYTCITYRNLVYTSSWVASPLCDCQIHEIIMAKKHKIIFRSKVGSYLAQRCRCHYR